MPQPPENECSVLDCHNEAERIKKVTGYIPIGGNKTREEEVFVVVCPMHFAGLEMHARMGHEPGALPDCSPLLCGHPSQPERVAR